MPTAEPHHLRRGPLFQTYFAAHGRGGIRRSSWPCFRQAPVAIGCGGAGATSSGFARLQLGHKDCDVRLEGGPPALAARSKAYSVLVNQLRRACQQARRRLRVRDTPARAELGHKLAVESRPAMGGLLV